MAISYWQFDYETTTSTDYLQKLFLQEQEFYNSFLDLSNFPTVSIMNRFHTTDIKKALLDLAIAMNRTIITTPEGKLKFCTDSELAQSLGFSESDMISKPMVEPALEFNRVVLRTGSKQRVLANEKIKEVAFTWYGQWSEPVKIFELGPNENYVDVYVTIPGMTENYDTFYTYQENGIIYLSVASSLSASYVASVYGKKVDVQEYVTVGSIFAQGLSDFDVTNMLVTQANSSATRVWLENKIKMMRKFNFSASSDIRVQVLSPLYFDIGATNLSSAVVTKHKLSLGGGLKSEIEGRV